MSERVDHAFEAQKLLARDMAFDEPDNAEISADVAALTHATLALVEQQRAQNLITLMASAARGVAENTYSTADYMELFTRLNPQIMAALGLPEGGEG